ncbi:MAG: hypothetical protein C5S49_01695 [Candidatus Methanogaster sp.]|nr:MAG: hypothetical protein C5S49_01695 [ANME-2 cluster archaeon]
MGRFCKKSLDYFIVQWLVRESEDSADKLIEGIDSCLDKVDKLPYL